MKKILVAAIAGLALWACDDRGRASTSGDTRATVEHEARARDEIANIRQDEARQKADVQRRAEEKIAAKQEDLDKAAAEEKRQTKEDQLRAERDAEHRADVANRRTGDRTTDLNRPAELNRSDVRTREQLSTAPRAISGTIRGHVVKGPLAAFSKTLTVRDDRGTELKLSTDDATRAKDASGALIPVGDLHEGTEVRASYTLDKDAHRIARDVTVIQPAAR